MIDKIIYAKFPENLQLSKHQAWASTTNRSFSINGKAFECELLITFNWRGYI